MCGMPLAYCELYVTLGTLFRRFDSLRVFQAKPEDLFCIDQIDYQETGPFTDNPPDLIDNSCSTPLLPRWSPPF